MTAPSASWPLPAEFDGYRLVRSIGRGGMGEVFLAHDTLLDRAVAIKFIAALDPTPVARARFLVEARAIARLQHPNIVAVYRAGEVHGQPYLVSEFVAGKSLDRVGAPLDWQKVRNIGLALARGLAAAHRRDVLHRDIKPHNAIITGDGTVKLLDFGLAKLLDQQPAPFQTATRVQGLDPALTPAHEITLPIPSDAHAPAARSIASLTDDGALVGTPSYMAPELWNGRPASPSSDVYALCVLLFYLCTGRTPHQADTLAALRAAICHEDAAPLAALVPRVDTRFAKLVDRCLCRDPARRFAVAGALQDAFERLDLDKREAATPTGNPYRGLRPFEAEHAALYFGRAAQVREVLERVAAVPVVLIAGDSGVGKSSLCRAGVLPRVERGALGDGRAWTTATLAPGRHPLAALTQALAPVLSISAETLRARLAEDTAGVCRELARRLGSGHGLLLFVDQLEELITIAEASEATAAAELVADLVDHVPALRLLATVRGDQLTRVATLPLLPDPALRGLYLLRPLAADGVREAIVGPAHALGVAFESDMLVDELVDAATETVGGLPLLQFALAELWTLRDPDELVISAAALAQLGGVSGALARHADAVIAALLPDERRAVRRLLRTLVTAGGTRERRSERELGADEPAARAALDALIRGRLVVAQDGEGEAVYAIAHEALLSGWDTLRDWLASDAWTRPVRERLARAATEWQRLGRVREALWSDRQLAEIAVLHETELSATDLAFLRASRAALRRRRLLRVAAVAAAPLLVAALWTGAHMKSRADLDRRIAAALADADTAVAEAHRLHTAAEHARTRLFAMYDAGTWQQADGEWPAVVEMDRRTNAAYERARHTLDGALVVDPGRRIVRARMADLAYERIGDATRAARLDEADELTSRLAAYDDDGERAARLARPATLAFASDPRGATLVVERYERDGQRRRLQRAARDVTTPGEPLSLPAGSYVLTLRKLGYSEVRYPIVLEAGQAEAVTVGLPRAEQVPDGFVYVPPGRFLFGSAESEGVRTRFLTTVPLHSMTTGGYLIGRNEVTFAEWIEFLRALPPGERQRRTPRVDQVSTQISARVALALAPVDGNSYELTFRPTPSAPAYRARAGEPIRYPARTRRAEQNWLRFPVAGVSTDDARAYASWLSRSGRVPRARLCNELEWERGARGADARMYP
ncbi:MAG: nSTAND1 domain-containing NTPase, partial [Polyangia bacterium]